MQDRIRSLEEANRENRRIIAALTSRIPELEARESPVVGAWCYPSKEPGEEEHAATEQPFAEGEPQQRRSWWGRIFGY
jgi:hypothetical protein